MLKETGTRDSEAFALRWTDVDFETKTVRITPSKGGEPRLLRISHKLLRMLNLLPKPRKESSGITRTLNSSERLLRGKEGGSHINLII